MSVLSSRPLLIVWVLQIATLSAQAPASLEDFLHSLSDHYAPSAVPKQEEALRFESQIEASPPEEISALLPLVFAALARQDETVVRYAGESLLNISLRPDGAELLRPHLNELYTLLNSVDLPLANLALAVLTYQRPNPPDEITGPLLSFVSRTDRNAALQARVLGGLLYAAYIARVPDPPEVLDGIERFMARPLDEDARTTVLDAIAVHPQSAGGRLIGIVLAALHDTRSAVRARAIHNVERLGRDVLAKAAPDLEKIRVDSNESQETRAAADHALRVWVGGDPAQRR